MARIISPRDPEEASISERRLVVNGKVFWNEKDERRERSGLTQSSAAKIEGDGGEVG